MKGLKKYTHEERARVVEEMIPLIRQKFGDDLLALAAQGSFARADDSGYSDLELVAFVREMPAGKDWEGVGRIRDGLLFELIWTTAEAYRKTTVEVTEMWFLAGSDVLLPLINPDFIENLNRLRAENLREKCLAEAKNRWHEVQEATAKTLNAVGRENRENLPLLFGDMLFHMLVTLSFLNRTPYVTFSEFVTRARLFEIKPADFDELLDAAGNLPDPARLEKTIESVFDGFETIFEEFGIELYDKEINI